MANDDIEQWHLPPSLRITNPKVAEASVEMAKELSAKVISPFARLSPQEFARIRAHARIEHLSSALKQIDLEIRANRGVEMAHKLREARIAIAGRLAENLAIVGHWALAAELAPDKRYRDEYAAKARASFEGHAEFL